ncbi:conjugative transposon protein TraM [Alistipes senegalensis]|uniref:Conjugative transposon protein TraM n=1 Tax=Alistipes senegalensis JC50 TaxID=1033732 RepID=A0ABY5V698_9BACT|nr:conjugative transposon protein TraM [Alistipes senegalensis]UEA87961.1 conjugative transposon protein TraM [Alistipes senegalensis]UWN64449.1 conjugative transposon protein TraM [Alistipes senegalensis JC50]
MKQNKNPTTDMKEAKPDRLLTEEQRQRRRKMLVYPLMGLLFAGSIWLIFAPSEKDKAESQQGVGFNTEMPLPTQSGIIADKRTAYEQAKMEEKQKERQAQMNDLAALFSDKDDKAETQSEEFDLLHPEPQQPARTYGGGSRPQRTIRSSAVAYEDINRTLGNFYETPAEDPEKEELRERIEELEAMMARQAEPSGSTLDDQVALLEKSYELAAKYMPAGQGGTTQQPSATDTEEDKKTVRNGKAVAQPVGQVTERIVSALAQSMTDSEFITAQTAERNFEFQTAVGTSTAVGRNTIPACVHGNQTVTDGQTVRLRLTEPMQVAGMRIPRNTVVVGAARVQGERLGIDITSLEYRGTIIPVELAVFDSDGQEGIFIPNSMEVSAAKEVTANMGSSLGSSINISTDAGAQLASDLGKGLIQGTSQYIAKKMRTVKVHLKAGYKVMLYQPED